MSDWTAMEFPVAPWDAGGADRFWTRVPVDLPDDQCWEWQGAKGKGGYGNFSLPHPDITGQRIYLNAHRFCYLLVHGQIPDGMVIRHKCDNPPCVNPSHLEIGSRSDNMRDAKSRGRLVVNPPHLRGEQNPRTKLTDAAVLKIRASDRRTSELASEFGVSRSRIRQLRRGEGWGHLPPVPLSERCSTHSRPGSTRPLCAYRGDDPARCPQCHMLTENCGGTHGRGAA